MSRYRFTLKNGTVCEAESRWLDTFSLNHELCNREPFIQVGDTVVAKDTIAVIQKIEEEKLETAEKEN